MSEPDFTDYGLAHKVVQALKKIVRDEIGKARPKASYAVVKTINVDDKSCTVVFPGGDPDTDGVRVPFTSVVPSIEGQTVRIGGSVNDRYIEAVMGTTDDLSRIELLEAEIAKRPHISGKWRLENNFSASSGAWRDIPIQGNFGFGAFDPSPGLINSGGWVTIPVSGYYWFQADVAVFPAGGSSERRVALARRRLGVPADIEYLKEELIQFYAEDSGSLNDIQAHVMDEFYFDAGDTVCATVWMGNTSTVYADGGRNGMARTTLSIRCLYAAEKYVTPPPA